MGVRECDVVIVGAGAAGAAVAWRLSFTDLNVVCLEQGSWMDPSHYPSTKLSWELAKSKEFSPDPNIRKSKWDYPINNDDSVISLANFNAVGGSTILFSGHFPRFHPSDFRAFSLDGVGVDWPITYDELTPFYEMNERNIGVAGLEGDPAYPKIPNLLPPVPLGKLGQTLAEGYNKLGWHWWPAYSAIATKPFDGRGACINLGPCNSGCAQNAKSSADVTYWPAAIQNGVELVTEARVYRIKQNMPGKVAGVSYYDSNNEPQEISARVVILAASAIGTPRLLLNSTSSFAPNGLGNTFDLVGRNLMLHPLGYVEGLFKENLDSMFGPQGCCISSQEFYESRPDHDFKRGFTMQVLRGPGPIEFTKNSYRRRKIKFGELHHADFLNRFNKTASIAMIAEDLPDLTNRIMLDKRISDSSKVPGVKVKYKLGTNTKKILSHSLSAGKELLTASGASEILSYAPVKNSGWHIMGTCSMGNSITSSVVNKNGRVHDIDNLYVADSSIFATSAAVNPAATLQALALFIANGIADDFSTRDKFNHEQ